MTWVTLGRGRLFFVLLMLPAVVYVVAWRLAPALYTIWLSLTQYNIVYDAAPHLNRLENYRRILHDGSLSEALRLSVIFAVIATAVELAVGLGAAAFFDSDPPGRNLLLGIFLLPMIMAPVVVGTVWSALFDRTVGPIPYLFDVLHGPDVQWLGTPVTAMSGLIISDAWEWAPLAALLLFSAMQTIPREQHEAARADGASSWQLFSRIVLPQITGMLVVAGGLRLMDAFLELDKVIVMTGGGPGTSTQLVSMYIYKQAFQAYELGYASTVITVLLVLLAVVYAFYLRHYGRMLRLART
ncbi:MAG: sugar ABC transporter permease [Bacillati bacterium ANGP1]|uniref:Sugar ABC transporter permease n=1 Tax=Candidatus Segetimicrobium genomatis TaxID=2569760 RepID=A0A537ITR2_9BACT|nr:MAG: sugar ABC transporter permease [Terrabacteria group bacterium ANGP1]